ncbi:MAG: hypothetical protein ACO1NW_04910 [Chitinophagaceae bacterium]
MPDKMVHPHDQIALPNLRDIITGMLKDFFSLLGFFSDSIKKGLFFIAALTFIGLAAGTVKYLISVPYYKASMIVVHNKLVKRTYGEILFQLNQLVEAKAHDKVAQHLGISRELAQTLLFIEGRNMNQDQLITDTSSKANQSFKIIAGLSNNSNLDSIEYAIIKYLNNIPYVKRVSDFEKLSSKEKIKFIDRDLEKLDTLKTEFNKFLSSSKVSATIYNNAINPSELYAQSNLLVNERGYAVRTLSIDNEAVIIIDGFKATDNYQSGSLKSSALKFGLYGMLIGLAIGMFFEAKRRVSN